MINQPPAWVKDAIFYQIFPDRFARSEKLTKPANLESWELPPTIRGFKGGDFLGIVEHLDYLEDLGINAIYFCPIFQSAANHRYHTHDYYTVDPILGGNGAFAQFLEQAHRRGIRVMLDGVFNHASRGFLQFNHIMENGPQSPYIDWFIVKKFPLRAFDDKRKPNYVCWWNNRELPKLNTDHPQVRDFIFNVAEYWLRQGIDGWRLDVPLEIKTPGFWEAFRRRVRAANPEAYILAEIWDEAKPWLQGDHFDAVMNYGFNRACYGLFGQETLDTSQRPGGFKIKRLDARHFARQIDHMLNLYAWPMTLAQYNLISSHDEPRFLTMVGSDKRRLRLATLFQMTFPGAPSVYYGDEIGMEGGADPDCRRAFPWDESRWDHDLRADFKRFIALRKAHPALRDGDFVTLYAKDLTYAFARTCAAEVVVVVVNADTTAVNVPINLASITPTDAVLTEAWTEAQHPLTGGALTLSVGPLEGRVLLCRPAG
ncbi:MAG TPA: alpha-amylase family glycosyl hydrolase [Anaerolineae bacterium]|nr:alpha-amylase family glycosyl hydrolase [Anaerolineae bacterium]HQI82995.1 alpha-amylase family glycosyl hydrolase [Anaerolineae bacterium]